MIYANQLVNYVALPGLLKDYDLKVRSRATPEKIIEVVCEFYQITLLQIKSKSRLRLLVDARKMVSFFLRKKTTMSLKAIGEIFGQDHTTVISSIRQMNGLLVFDEKIKQDYEHIKLLM